MRHILLPWSLFALYQNWIMPRDFLSYKVCSPTHWIFASTGFPAVSNPDTLRFGVPFAHSLSCGSPLCSWWVSVQLPCLSDLFGGGSKVVWGTWFLLPRNLVLMVCPCFFGIIPLVAGLSLPFDRYWLTDFLWGRIGPVVPFWYKGLRSFCRYWFTIITDVPGALLLNYWPCLPWWRNFRG